MWKPKIYIGTSLFDCILSSHKESASISLELIQRCKDQFMYTGFVSPFTIYELEKRYTKEQINSLVSLLNENHIWLINYGSPIEIDHLVNWYKNSEILPESIQLDYYHLATCSYLNIEFYVCWNKIEIANFQTFRKIVHTHKPHGYRSVIHIETPEYFTERENTENTFNIIEPSLSSKKECLDEINNFPVGQRALFTQQKVMEIGNLIFNKINLPNKEFLPARIPLLDLSEVELRFETKSFDQIIKDQSIPLFDLNYNATTFEMDYHMLELTTLQGEVLLKNKQLEIIYHLPVGFSEADPNNIKQERISKFINWLLPQIRCAFDHTKIEFPEIKSERIRSYSFNEIDFMLAQSVDTKSIKEAKSKAIELTDFITGGAWQEYQGFIFSGEWCNLNSGFGYGLNDTHIIIHKDGKRMWVLLINPIIP